MEGLGDIFFILEKIVVIRVGNFGKVFDIVFWDEEVMKCMGEDFD